MNTSVIIPTFNSERFLKDSIESVLHQTEPAKEIIVVDGGSTDSTERICRSYKDLIFLKQKGKGVGNAMNEGIEASSGHYIKIHDSDDILFPEALNVLEATISIGVGIAYGNYIMIDKDGKPFAKGLVSDSSSRRFLKALWRRNVVSHISALITRECFETVGKFDEMLGMAEDYDWMLRAAFLKNVNFRYVPLILSAYRVHGNNLSTANNQIGNFSIAREKMEEKISTKQKNFVSVAYDCFNCLQKFSKGKVLKTRIELALPTFFDEWFWLATKA